jgi:hypothetical protein
MTRGGPDWGVADYQIAGIQVDLASIADRIRGFGLIDQRGRVQTIDTFDNGLDGWQAYSSGSGSDPVVKSMQQYAYAGPCQVVFDAGLVAGGVAGIQKLLHLGEAARIGLEIGLYWTGSEGNLAFSIIYNAQSGSAWLMQLEYNSATNVFNVVSTGGVRVAVSDADAQLANNLGFLSLKLVADFETGMYERFMYGEVQRSIETTPMFATATVEGLATVGVQVTVSAAANGSMVMTYGALTKDEP